MRKENRPEHHPHIMRELSQFKADSPFVLQTPSSSQTLTTVPGEIDFDACFIQGSAKCFIANSGSIIRKPKTLLMKLDKDIEPVYTKEFMLDSVARLHQQGFKIYTCVSKKNSYYYSSLDDANKKARDQLIFTAASRNGDAKELAEQLGISVEDILVVDNERFKSYLEGEETDFEWLTKTTEFLSTGFVNFNGSGITLGKLIEFLKKYGSNITGIDLSSCWGLYESVYKSTALVELITELSFPNLSLPKLVHFRYENDTTCYHNTCTNTAMNIQTLLLQKIKSNMLIELSLAYAPSYVLTDFISKDKQASTINLKYITLTYSEIHPPDIQILENAAELVELNLSYCDFKVTESDMDNDTISNPSQIDIALTSLEVLDVSNSSINVNHFNAIIKKAERIKILKLAKCEALWDNDCIAKTEISKSSLEQLDISDNTLSIVQLQSLLQDAQKLKVLKLTNSSLENQDTHPFAFSEINAPTAIEELDCSDSNISLENIFTLIYWAQSLKILNFGYCNNLYFENEFDEDNQKIYNLKNLENLEKLETLILDATPIIFSDFDRLIKIAVNIRHLDISFCSGIGEGVMPEGEYYQTSSLESLKADCCEGPKISNLLKRLLFNSFNLKELYLTQFVFSADETFDDIKLISLELIDIAWSNITAQQFANIICKARNLKKIILDSEKAKNQDFRNLCNDESLPEKVRIALRAEIDKKTSEKPASNPDKHAGLQHRKIIRKHRNLSNPQLSSLGIDAETQYIKEDSPRQVKQLFQALHDAPQIPVNFYRLFVFDDLEFRSVSDRQPFTLKAIEYKESSLVTCNVKPFDTEQKISGKYSYIGATSLILSSQWQPLPSLSAHECIESIGSESGDDMDVAFNPDNGLHYIRLSGACASHDEPTAIKFIISVDPQQLKGDTTALPIKLKELQTKYQNFRSGVINNTDCISAEDLLNALIKQQIGSCRHRVVGFLYEAKKLKGYGKAFKVRIVENGLHIFPEIVTYDGALEKEVVTQCDLGGYARKVEIKPIDLSDSILTVSSNESSTSHTASKSYITPIIQWHPKSQDAANTHEWLTTIYSNITTGQSLEISEKNVLCDIPEADIFRASVALSNHCQENGNLVYHIDGPDQLRCQGRTLKEDENGNINLTDKKDGSLYHFLTKRTAQQKVVIIDYSKFTAAEIVATNSLLDHFAENGRDIDGIHPEPLQVIGLYDLESDKAYTGTDFLSRFNPIIKNKKLPDDLAKIQPRTQPYDDEEHTSFPAIDFYEAPLAWRQHLFGQLQLHGPQITFIKSNFLKGLEEGKNHFTFANLPSTPEIEATLRRGMAEGFIEVYGKRYDVPPGLTIYQKNGYDFSALQQATQSAEIVDAIPANAQVLNSQTISDWLGGHRDYDRDTQSLLYTSGRLAQAKPGAMLDVAVTGSLSLTEWAKFNVACKDKTIKINFYISCHAVIPATIKEVLPELPTSSMCPLSPYLVEQIAGKLAIGKTLEIVSSDYDVTLAQLSLQIPNIVALPISEIDPGQLFIRYKPHIDEVTQAVTFEQQTGALLTLLEAGETVALYGDFSCVLRDRLQALIADQQVIPGRLILISNSPTHLMNSGCYQHQVTAAEKKLLVTSDNFTDEQLNTQPLAELRAMEQYCDDPQAPWRGMKELPSRAIQHTGDLSDCQRVADAFDAHRLAAVYAQFKRAPFAFLSGISGIGKTTFVEKVLGSQPGVILKHGLKELSSWAEPTKPGEHKILFIDEANIGQTDWSVFESIFARRPGVLVDNEMVLFDKDAADSQRHIVFAGNPLSYGGERHMPQFFARHGGSVVFDTMPAAYIYERILKPIFANTPLATMSNLLSKQILDVYNFLMNHSEQEALISARELEMMALMTLVTCINEKTTDNSYRSRFFAQYYAERYGAVLVPQHAQAEFAKQFPRPKEIHKAPKLSKLAVTDNNREAIYRMLDYLTLHNFRVINNDILNDKQRCGGLGRLSITGEPGLGKTLLTQKLAENLLHPSNVVTLKAGMSLNQKRKLLIDAWDKGQVVLYDEANSSPSFGELLNQLLMGRYVGRLPKRAGFCLICTGNDASQLHGRRVATVSDKRRTHEVKLPSPDAGTLNTILNECYRGKLSELEPQQAEQLVHDIIKDYLSEREQDVALCTRDLIRCMGEVLKAQLAENDDRDDFSVTPSTFGLFATTSLPPPGFNGLDISSNSTDECRL